MVKHSTKLFLLLITLLVPWYGVCQVGDKPLPLDETGKIIFMEVVSVDSVSKENLLQRARHFMENLAEDSRGIKKEAVNLEEYKVDLPMYFTVYHDFPLKSPHGIIKYNLTIETKDGRYRYLATDFVFHYLKRNRYGKFVEVKGKSKPLETPVFKGQQRLWEVHKVTLSEKLSHLIEELKQTMQQNSFQKETEIVRIEEQW